LNRCANTDKSDRFRGNWWLIQSADVSSEINRLAQQNRKVFLSRHNANAGWKGRGIWATFSSRAPFHMETGGGTTPQVFHFQMRPNPPAKPRPN
jgi:hypothetical protein